MQRSFFIARFWLTILGLVILVAGLAGAGFVRTQAHAGAVAQYRIVGGQAYQESSADSKRDADDVERYGGTVAVIGAAYRRKFQQLLQSDKLVWLMVGLSVILSGLCFRAAWEAGRHD
jgi:hypothetical protein